MRRVFGVKKDKEPPPSINDASDRVLFSFNFIYLGLLLPIPLIIIFDLISLQIHFFLHVMTSIGGYESYDIVV